MIPDCQNFPQGTTKASRAHSWLAPGRSEPVLLLRQALFGIP